MRAIDSLLFTEQSAPATPGTGLVALYPKADGKLYIKDDTGAETDLTATGGAGGSVDWKDSVRVATTAAGTLATSFENGDIVDGVTLVTGDRILIKDQVAGAENGIYVVNASGAPTRATDADASAEVTGGMTVRVSEGTENRFSEWFLDTFDPIVLGTTALLFSTRERKAAGAAATPSYGFSGNNGMYLSTTNTLGFSTNGTARLAISTTNIAPSLPIYAPDGSVSAPSYSFGSGTNTGMYSSGGVDIRLTTAGTTRLTISATAAVATVPFFAPDGSNTNPSVAFTNDPDTGLYSVGSNSLGLTTSGTLRVTLNTVALTTTLPVRGADGTAAAPTFAFSGATGTGIYRTGAGSLGLSTAGTVRVTVDSNAVTTDVPLWTANGAAGTPSYSFLNDPNTGMYQTGTADTLAFVTGGNPVLTLTAAREARLNDQFDIEVMTWMVD
jgi:hypothetical protein